MSMFGFDLDDSRRKLISLDAGCLKLDAGTETRLFDMVVTHGDGVRLFLL